ncbi:aspartate kinase [Flavobacteriaceae bacterium]|nr:aspartate kinase [Flavobacteriaceae bacterium]
MKVYKFGGASVASADGVRILTDIVREEKNLVLVISAMGKMTNAFETYVNSRFDVALREEKLEIITSYHLEILSDLFEENHVIFEEFLSRINELRDLMLRFHDANYDFLYDQIVPYGELISTQIVTAFLNEKGLEYQWKDARKMIRTDEFYREALVNWELSEVLINENIHHQGRYVTQGFVGGSENGLTTTLGREGSDYSAAIIAYCLNMEALVIWKDVDGVLNADPRHFEKTTLLEKISYAEAIEMAFYGASVIHPKTLKPLENKGIPLMVKSFLNPMSKGTLIQKNQDLFPEVPCFILKQNQVLISISARDFSFIVEDNIRHIFEELHRHKLKVNLIQNSALEFVVCVTDKYHQIEAFNQAMSNQYKLQIKKRLNLITVRHSELADLSEFDSINEVLVKQSNDEAYQLVVLPK